GNPQLKLQEKRVIDSGCSRHMTGNKTYLLGYEEIDGGFVAFRGDPKGGRITGKGKISTDTECVVLSPDFKLLDENHVLLRVPRKDNMYSVDLKNIVPLGGLTCLFAKATLDEYNLWHRRLGHIKFKTMNKLVRGNLVRGLPSKILKIIIHVLLVRKESNIKPLVRPRLKPVLSFMRPFGCLVTIHNTLDHLGNRPNWLFDIDGLTISMNYKPVVAGNQANGNAGTKENIDTGQDGKKIVPDQEYILLPLLTSDPSLSKSSKDSPDTGFKPSGEEEKMDYKHLENKDSEVPNTKEPKVHQEQDANVNSTNNINTVYPTVNVADIENNVVDENIVYGCIDDPSMHNLEEIVYSDDDEEVGAETDMNNLAITVLVSPIPTTRVHPLEQIIRDIHSVPQTRRMTKNVTKHGMFSSVQQRINHKDFQNCLFACFLSQVEPKKVIQALTDPS
ncbi:ribonuclease H-like domain-containing protein, partial [Tanacetum coccineum]